MARSDPLIKIVPIRIGFLYELNLPLAIPLLQVFFSLNGRFDIGELLEINQTIDTISSGKSRDKFRAMLVNASYQIVSDADVKCASDPAREDVYPV